MDNQGSSSKVRVAAVGVFVSLTLAAFLLIPGSPPKKPLLVATNVWSGYEPLYVAREAKAWDDEQVRLVECSSATQVLRLFRNETVDVAALTLDEVLQLRQDGIDARVFLVTDVSDGGDVILASEGVKRLADLSGARIGVEDTALGAYVFTRACQLEGVDPCTLTVVPLEVHEHEEAFLGGRVDAVVTFEPVLSKLLAAGGRLLFTSKQIPGEIVDVLVARPEVFETHTEELEILVQGWFGALDHLAARPEDAARIMAPRLQLTPAEALTSFEGLKLPTPEENRAFLAGSPPGLLPVAQKLKEVMLQSKLLKREPPLSTLTAPSVVAEFSAQRKR